MTLYSHQQRFIDKNPDRALLVWEGGLGKTVAGCEWLKKRASVPRLVVCPKSIIEKWKRELIKWGVKGRVDVVSRDDIKKMSLSKYRAIILDEAQDFAAPLFDRGGSRSQRATVIYNHIRSFPETHVLLLTATPVRSTAWNIHTLACYLGVFWKVHTFRNQFFYLTDMYGRMHYEKVKGWQKLIRPYIEEIADIVLMKDVVDVPMQHNQVVTIKWTDAQEKAVSKEYLEPVAKWHRRHRLENGEEKLKALTDILDRYRKVIVVCYYREQIEDYAKKISKERLVYTLHGGVKDQDKIIKEAQEADDCIFIVQASMGAGFDADQFSVVVFASMSFKYVDYAQMKYRVKRIHNLHENTFIHLLGGRCDRGVYETIEAGKDFDPHEYMAKLEDEDKLDF